MPKVLRIGVLRGGMAAFGASVGGSAQVIAAVRAEAWLAAAAEKSDQPGYGQDREDGDER